MIKFKSNEEKLISFAIKQASDLSDAKIYSILHINDIGYMFNGKIVNDKIEISIPPLSSILIDIPKDSFNISVEAIMNDTHLIAFEDDAVIEISGPVIISIDKTIDEEINNIKEVTDNIKEVIEEIEDNTVKAVINIDEPEIEEAMKQIDEKVNNIVEKAEKVITESNKTEKIITEEEKQLHTETKPEKEVIKQEEKLFEQIDFKNQFKNIKTENKQTISIGGSKTKPNKIKKRKRMSLGDLFHNI